MTKIQTLPHQIKFINSTATHTGLVAGYGSGKSIAATLKTIKKHLQYPMANVAYYLPTYPLIKDIAYPNFEKYLNIIGVDYELNKSDKEITTNYGLIKFRSMDNPQYIVGYEVGYSLIDEADVLPKKKMQDAYIRIVGRNRKPLYDGTKNCTDVVSTPEGFGWMYDYFVKNKKGVLIRAKTKDNPYLPKSYIDDLKDTYTEQQLQAYLNGEFVNLTSGNVYNLFDIAKHNTTREVIERDILHVGLDFNITNMSAVIHVIDKGKFYAVDEVVGAYDTRDIISVLKQRYSKHSIIVYPDASGNNRNTSGYTDIQLLKGAGFVVRDRAKNPFVKDRVNEMNNRFEKLDYFINSSKCPNYTDALNQLAYKNGVPDKESGFDHLTDAGGYFIYYQKSEIVRIR